MKHIRIDVVWHTDQSRALENLDLDYDVEDCTLRTMIFYKIDAISPTTAYAGKDYTRIFSCGEQFVVPFDMDYVERLINDML